MTEIFAQGSAVTALAAEKNTALPKASPKDVAPQAYSALVAEYCDGIIQEAATATPRDVAQQLTYNFDDLKALAQSITTLHESAANDYQTRGKTSIKSPTTKTLSRDILGEVGRLHNYTDTENLPYLNAVTRLENLAKSISHVDTLALAKNADEFKGLLGDVLQQKENEKGILNSI